MSSLKAPPIKLYESLSLANIQKPNEQSILKQCAGSKAWLGKQKGLECGKGRPDRGGNFMADRYKLQNHSLRSTISILSDKLEALSQNCQFLNIQNKQFERQIQKRKQQTNSLMPDYQQLKQKSQQYDDIVLKIDQLEHIEDQLLLENERLKNQQILYRKAMATILVLVGNNQTLAMGKIGSAIREACQAQ